MKKRYYFDYNIYEKIRRGEMAISDEFLRNNDIFLSVSHIEEYYKAYKNDLNNMNQEKLRNLKSVMIEVSKKRVILNPQIKGRIIAKGQTFEECFDVIQKYDTREIIDKHGEKINSHESRQIELLRKDDNTATHNSALNKEDIWNRAEVIKGLEDFQNYYQNYCQNYYQSLKETLIPKYYYYAVNKAVPKLPKDFDLKKCCFKNSIPDFRLLECVIEYLSKLLGECGYCRDKEIRKTKSGIHDVTHSIYATYCNYLITNDVNFRKRADAIYYYLGIDTIVLSVDDFLNVKDLVSK